MNYVKEMFSSSNAVSWGRSMATMCMMYVMLTNTVIMYKSPDLKWPVVDMFWQVVIVALFAISKAGETAQAFAKKE